MDVVTENFSPLVVISVLVFLVFYAIALNLYFIQKNGFQVSVNCWFCNRNSKVLYAQRNNFECPFCSQYNGFSKNGDYNKVIEAQHNELLNSLSTSYQHKTGFSSSKSSNNLCDSCNKNQQLKISQLANYEPLNEKNFNVEIEHFRKQLEKSYKLCKRCSKTLKNTIRRQNAWLFGNRLKKLKNFKTLTSRYFKLNKPTQGFVRNSNFFYNFSIVRLTLLFLSVLTLSKLFGLESFTLTKIVPQSLLPSNVIFSDIYTKIYNFTETNFGTHYLSKGLPKKLKIRESESFYLSLLGLCIELLFTIFEGTLPFFGKCSQLLSWLILGVVSSIKFKNNISLYSDTLQIFCALWLVYSYSFKMLKFGDKKPNKFALKRFEKNVEDDETCSEKEDSGSDAFNDSQTSFKSAINKNSPITAFTANHTNANLNKSFGSVRSRRTLHNGTFNNQQYTANNLGLYKTFNDLHIGAFESPRPMSCQTVRNTSSPNPFFNQSDRPQSPNSMYDYNKSHNPNNSFTSQVSNGSLFKLNNSFSSNTNDSFSVKNHNSTFNVNPSVPLSPKSFRSECYPVNTAANVIYNSNNLGNLNVSSNKQQPTSFVLQNKNVSPEFVPRDTSSVFSFSTSLAQKSPTLRSQNRKPDVFLNSSQREEYSLNNSFRPLSPSSTIDRPNRTLVSPSKFNLIKSFHSDSKDNELLNLSFHVDSPSTTSWPNVNGLNIPQRFVVNSLSDVQCNSPLNGSLMNGHHYPEKNISRSSSSSSGFVSNNDFGKARTQSLPNSRDHSPDRNSLLSEPAYHFKMN